MCSGAMARPRNLVERMVFSVAFHTDFRYFLYLKMQSQNADKPVYYSTQILFGKHVIILITVSENGADQTST
jgi:hypothetical protein